MKIKPRKKFDYIWYNVELVTGIRKYYDNIDNNV